MSREFRWAVQEEAGGSFGYCSKNLATVRSDRTRSRANSALVRELVTALSAR